MPKLSLGLDLASRSIGNLIPWTPNNISTVFWYDAADLSTITATGNQVTQMLDKSGNGWTIAPITAGKIGPNTGTRTLNRLNVLDYDKTVTTNQVLENNSFASIQPLCIASVLRFDDEGIAGDQDFLFSGTETTTPRIAIRRVAATSSWQILTDAGAVGSGTDSAAEGFDYIGSFCFNTTSTTIRINGTLVNTGTIPNNLFDSLNIGNNEVENTPLDGFIAEMIAFSDLANQEIIEGYLAWKWGLTSKLPANHRYKTSTPYI